MEIPTHLKHKPVFVAENYNEIDGRYASKSDVQGLSLGLAQWNEKGQVDISAKVWRHTGERWSRQSEEMPLHRVLDLALFICKTHKYMREAYRHEGLYDAAAPNIGRVELQGKAMDINVNTANPELDEDIRLFQDCLAKEDERIGERLTRLAEVLKELGYAGR
ncbi:MAG: hypothetical protein EOP88_19580 [Verrucomicrobiaceae bacterium]|nr:MAG: hypothetical protein EOP88_19580 [Verrucomicrobiaceae bacterium]